MDPHSRFDATGKWYDNDSMTMPRYDLATLVGNKITASEVRRLLNAAHSYLESQPEEKYLRAGTDLALGLRETAAQHNVDPGELFRALRVALQGRLNSPAVFESMKSMGKDETLARLDLALRALNDQAST
jgi:glutamyl/glutaminyl-tRNA synthetase